VQIVKTPKFVQLLYPSLVWKKENSKKEIYLTFDDSPTPEFTLWILNLLSNLNINATFFCVGESSEKHPDIIDEILNNGHQIGNHTYSHKNGFLCFNKWYLQDIEKCKNVLPNTNLFRPPFGKIYPWQISKIKEKYKIIMWDVLSYDFTKNISDKKLKSNVLNNVEDGSIIVFHDNKKSEKILKESLEEILINLKEKGFVFSLFSSDTEII
tara:strand:- start:266 stop:898 length:633 start_codon:yes stop_codon:yes gene_type:complete